MSVYAVQYTVAATDVPVISWMVGSSVQTVIGWLVGLSVEHVNHLIGTFTYRVLETGNVVHDELLTYLLMLGCTLVLLCVQAPVLNRTVWGSPNCKELILWKQVQISDIKRNSMLVTHLGSAQGLIELVKTADSVKCLSNFWYRILTAGLLETVMLVPCIFTWTQDHHGCQQQNGFLWKIEITVHIIN